jgi:hypothetical protein
MKGQDMKLCSRLLASVFIILTLYSVNGQGTVIIQHSGYNDPLSEGFGMSYYGIPQVAGVTNDLGYNAWATRFSSSGVEYSDNIGNLTGLDWILSVTVRVAATDVNPYGDVFGISVSTGNASLGMAFGSDSNGNQLVLVQGDEYTVNGSTYNNYQLIYDASANTASFWINGTQELSGITGFVPSVANLSWGGGYQSPSSYQADWNLVSLQIIPEPSILTLIGIIGLPAILLFRRVVNKS